MIQTFPVGARSRVFAATARAAAMLAVVLALVATAAWAGYQLAMPALQCGA